MPCRTFRPIAELAPFVESLYFISQHPGSPQRHMVSPNGFMDLVIHLENRSISWFLDGKKQSVTGPLLAGAYSKPFFLDLTEFTGVLGVRFTPGAARLFFPVPAHELHNLDIALADVYRVDAQRLMNDICNARPLERQVELVQQFLLGKLNGGSGVDAAVEHAVRMFRRPDNRLSVGDIECAVGMSHTRFIQVFRQSVGMTPKLFFRVQRFQSAVRAIEGGAANWAELAAGCGYYDQAHLIRDFREFSGLTPPAYAQRILAYQELAAVARAAG